MGVELCLLLTLILRLLKMYCIVVGLFGACVGALEKHGRFSQARSACISLFCVVPCEVVKGVLFIPQLLMNGFCLDKALRKN